MRPVRLEMEGFAAFREPTVVDFDGVELFALVGPTGAGKSSVIDAMCFALYGSVPRYDDRRKVADAVSVGALECRVSLTFESGRTRYLATRVVRRGKNGAANTKEARLEVDGGDVLAGSEREMSRLVEQEVLGLSFAHFTRAVVLPQGEFARFLHDGPKERQQLLVELLGLGDYQEMMRAANLLAAEHQAAASMAEQRLAELADATPQQHELALARADGYAGLREELRGARADLDRLAQELSAAEAELDRCATLLGHLGAVAVPSELEELGDERARRAARLDTARAAAKEAEQERAARAEALAELGDRDALLAARGAHAQLAGLVERRVEAEAALAASRTVAESSRAALEEAEAECARAEAEVAGLQRAHAAHVLAGTLTAGDPCPVCEQVVAAVPRRARPSALGAAERVAATAAKARDRARRAVEEAGQDLARHDATRAGLAQSARELEDQVRAHPDPVVLDAGVAEHDAVRAALEAATEAEHRARRAEREAQQGVDALGEQLGRATRRFRAQRDPIVGAGAIPPEEAGDLIGDWRALAGWAAETREELDRVARAATAAAQEARTARDARLGALRARADELGLDARPDAPVDDLLERATEAEVDARSRAQRIAAELEEAARLSAQRAQVERDAELARLLAGLLRSDKFERWLLDEAFSRLATGASERLHSLSGGQYSLRFDEGGREFVVVDHRNADETRSVKTLSGGETFQASLALALTLADELAEMATGRAARLDSIFLDEGFGTLDPDTLDTVASTIEALGAGDRMVGLVTHVPELGERVPVRYRVAKEGRSSVVVQELS